MSDIVERLRNASTYALMDAARPLVLEAAGEIVRLRGEVSLWRSAATLTPEERRVMVNAICELEPAEPGRRLRHLYERLTHEVPA